MQVSEDGSQLSSTEPTSLSPTTPAGTPDILPDDKNPESPPHSAEHPSTTHIAQDLLLNKDQEIETLNQELLEFEDRLVLFAIKQRLSNVLSTGVNPSKPRSPTLGKRTRQLKKKLQFEKVSFTMK